ncbi:MAG TPA: hypothetical protein VGR98_27990 [Streptosporangiaceae bacterium]|nr:hypothetical protein [Streptosporangiaceae bacterium]
MSVSMPEIDPIKVHIASSDVPMAAAAPRRTRKALRTNTYTLTAAQATQRLLPRSATRLEAWVTSATEATPPVIYIAPNQADAASQAGGAAQVIGTETTPVPLNTTDEVWVSAATGYPVTVSVWAIYEVTE